MEASPRTILFKTPTVERPQYTQKILDILGSPSNVTIKMTTYRSRWIPSKVYENPKYLEKKLAWVICVDIRTDADYRVQRFIPVREVEIVKAVRDGDNLILWLETQNYISCPDYEKLREELEKKIKTLPPAENSYIACDVQISSVKVIDSSEESKVNEDWKEIVDALGSMDVFRNAIFYRVIGISKGSSYLKTEDSGNVDEPQKFYRLTVNETYKLQIYYSLPERQFEHCPQYIEISANEWARIYDECKINDRGGSLSVLMKPSQTSDQYPYKNTISLNASIKPGQLIGPSLRLPLIFVKERRLARFRHNLGKIVYSILFLFLFFFGQILPSMYETVYGVPSSIIGPALSTLAITLISLVFADIFGKGT